MLDLHCRVVFFNSWLDPMRLLRFWNVLSWWCRILFELRLRNLFSSKWFILVQHLLFRALRVFEVHCLHCVWIR